MWRAHVVPVLRNADHMTRKIIKTGIKLAYLLLIGRSQVMADHVKICQFLSLADQLVHPYLSMTYTTYITMSGTVCELYVSY